MLANPTLDNGLMPKIYKNTNLLTKTEKKK